MNHRCQEDLCVTCSDFAAQAEVLRLERGGMALVRIGAAVERVSVALVDTQVGGTVLVHAGEAIGVIRATRDD